MKGKEDEGKEDEGKASKGERGEGGKREKGKEIERPTEPSGQYTYSPVHTCTSHTCPTTVFPRIVITMTINLAHIASATTKRGLKRMRRSRLYYTCVHLRLINNSNRNNTASNICS